VDELAPHGSVWFGRTGVDGGVALRFDLGDLFDRELEPIELTRNLAP
jgi:hypothetical protein